MKLKKIITISTLLSKKITGKLPPSEENDLNEWMNEHPESKKYFTPSFMNSIDKEKDIEESIRAYEYFVYRNRRGKLRVTLVKYGATAAVLAGLFIGLIYLSDKPSPQTAEVKTTETVIKNKVEHSIKTKKDKTAVLELADGSAMNIENNKEVITVNSSEICIGEKKVNIALKTESNRLKIPRGTEYSIVLEDGTKVWLNADSELIFPSQFEANERRVKGKGELYFEVAKDSSRPFIFEAGDVNITVLGTAFNVRCYEDGKPNETTLVSGSVKLTSNNKDIILSPGHKCSVINDDMTVTQVNVDEYTSWTKGVFLYKNKPLRAIMDDLERVYDVTATFKDKELENITFSGSFKRYGDLNNILDMLKISGNITFKYSNDTIIISK